MNTVFTSLCRFITFLSMTITGILAIIAFIHCRQLTSRARTLREYVDSVDYTPFVVYSTLFTALVYVYLKGCGL